MIREDEPQIALACMEVWGGNRSVNRIVELPDLTAWVYSKPTEAPEGGGDVHYLSVCGQAVLFSRIVLADVSGHGTQVSPFAQVLHALMREHINTWDQTEFLRGLNTSFRGSVAGGTYATAVILGVLSATGETAFSNAGHPAPLWYRARSSTWSWLEAEACELPCGSEGLPVGLFRETDYRQTLIQLAPGDILVLYTDGISEAVNDFGEMLGSDRLMEWMRSAPIDGPAETGGFLLSRLDEFRGQNVTDDETIIAIKRGN